MKLSAAAICARRAPAAALAATFQLCRQALPLPPLAVRLPLVAAPRGTRLPRKRCQLPRATSSEDSPHADQPLAADSPVMEVERQTERALAYAAVTALLGGSGLALAAAPSAAVQFLWGACPGLLVAGMARVLGSVLLLAAICANCLKEAAEKDLLRSDTYRRLNLALFWWGLGTVAALWLAPQQPLRYALGVCTVLLAGTSAHAALTYHETSDEGEGWSPVYLAKQFLRSLGNLTSYSNGPDTAIYSLYTYGFAAKATLAAVTAAVMHRQLRLAVDGLLLAPLGLLGESLVAVNGVGYALGAVVLFTLKDAAARGRLGASTFRALNIGVAVMALANGITIASWVQAGVVAQTKAVCIKLASHALLAALALCNYAFAQKKKH